MSTYLERFAARCREQRWFNALFHVDVLRDIMVDLRAWLRGLRDDAHKAEVLELEADKEIRAGMACMKAGEPAAAQEHFMRADRLTQRAAEVDHDLTEGLATD